MNITLEISPQTQAELARQAAISGREVELLATSLLEQALHRSPSEPTFSPEKERPFGISLVDAFAQARDMGLFEDGGMDFSRDPSPGRPIDLS